MQNRENLSSIKQKFTFSQRTYPKTTFVEQINKESFLGDKVETKDSNKINFLTVIDLKSKLPLVGL